VTLFFQPRLIFAARVAEAVRARLSFSVLRASTDTRPKGEAK
jgi:hypothetical protein